MLCDGHDARGPALPLPDPVRERGRRQSPLQALGHVHRLPALRRQGDRRQNVFLQRLLREAVDVLEGVAADHEAGARAEGLVAKVLQVDEGFDEVDVVGHVERVAGGDVVEALPGAGEAGARVGEEVGEDGAEPVRGGDHVDVQDGEEVAGAIGEGLGESGAEVEVGGFGVRGHLDVAAGVVEVRVGGGVEGGDGFGEVGRAAVVEDDDAEQRRRVVLCRGCFGSVEDDFLSFAAVCDEDVEAG